MSASPAPTWFGQPRGLTVLFLTNMWEQFSYYGMRALLVYYMTKQLLIGQEQSSFIYGAYTACAYFTPIIGGAIADRYLGKRRAVIIGASVMALEGQACLARQVRPELAERVAECGEEKDGRAHAQVTRR